MSESQEDGCTDKCDFARLSGTVTFIGESACVRRRTRTIVTLIPARILLDLEIRVFGMTDLMMVKILLTETRW